MAYINLENLPRPLGKWAKSTMKNVQNKPEKCIRSTWKMDNINLENKENKQRILAKPTWKMSKISL